MDRVKCFKFSVNYIEKLNLVPTDTLLVVSIIDQLMFLYNERQCVKTYVISTSKLPPSCVENSLGTPWGLHQISEIIGLCSPIGTVFKGRVDTGQIYGELPDSAKIGELGGGAGGDGEEDDCAFDFDTI